MKRLDATWFFALAAGLVCGSLSISERPVFGQGAETLVMVANKTNPSASVSKGDAKKMLLGQMTAWPDGAPVVIVLTPAGSAQRAAVLTKICGMSESDYTKYQLQVAFTRRTPATIHEEHSVAGVTSFVKAHPGAIGFLRKSDAGDDIKAVMTLE